VTLFIILLSVLTWLNYTNRSLPISATSLTHGSYTLNGIIEHFPKTPKGQLIKDGLDLPKKEPLVFIFGSGPGTFLSVAANSRTPKDTLKVMMAYTRESVRISSKLPDFIKPFTTWIKYKYGKSYLLFKDYGSTIYDWGGSFLNIYFEMGIIGLAIIFWFFYYLARLITKIDYKHKTFMISTVVLFFMINFIASWLDQQNFMIFQSILFATFLKTTNTKF